MSATDTTIRRGRLRPVGFADHAAEFCTACALKGESELERASYALRTLIDERMTGNGIFRQISRREYIKLFMRQADAFLEALAAVEG